MISFIVGYVLLTAVQYCAIYHLMLRHLQGICPSIAQHSLKDDQAASRDLANKIAWVPIVSVIATLAVTGLPTNWRK